MAPRALYEMNSVASHNVVSVGSVCEIDEDLFEKGFESYCYYLKFIRGRIWLTLPQAMKELVERRHT